MVHTSTLVVRVHTSILRSVKDTIRLKIFRGTRYRTLPDLMDGHQIGGPRLGPGRDPPGNYHPLTCPAAVSVDGDPQPTTRPRPVDLLMMHPKTASNRGKICRTSTNRRPWARIRARSSRQLPSLDLCGDGTRRRRSATDEYPRQPLSTVISS